MKSSRRPSFTLRNCRAFLLAATLLGAGLQAAPVLPSGANVVAGAGAVSTAGSTLTVTQSTAKLAVNWDSFSIGEGATVRFVQPSASSVALNRVIGGDASVIQGALTSNGQVFLLNPSGVLFSKTAQVSVGGLVASTLALSNEDFLAGNYAFGAPGAGLVVNEGSLVAVDGGSISLIAAKVINDGSIAAERGSVNLVAGSRVTLNLGGLVNLTVDQGAIDALVSNGGAIRADGGQVLLTARGAGELAPAAISNAGLIEARTLATGEQGEIRLLGGLTGGDAVSLSGSLDVSAPHGGNGGFVETSAAFVNIADSAVITSLSASGTHGTWLLDPTYIEIVATGGVGSVGGLPATGTSQISVGTLSTALNAGNVSLEAVNQIDFQVAFNHAGTADSVLTLLAPTIKLGGDIYATGHHLGLTFGNGTTYAGNVFLYNPAGAAVITRTLTTNGGDVVFNGNIGGAHDLVIDAGAGQVRLSATVDGTFSCWQQVYGDLAFRYQAGGRVGDTTTIDFTNSTVSFFDGVTTYQANQSELSAISGRPYSFPTGYLVIPANTVMDLNAQRVPITLTHPDGTTDGTLTSANNGQVTFPNVATPISKLEFEQTNGSWTEILAVGISWMSNTAAGKLRNLTVKSSQVTIDAGRTIAVNGDIRISTAKLVNNSGASALSAGAGKTWQVWSTNLDPFDLTTGDVDGNLPYDFKQYGATYGVTTPLGTGNGMFYSYQPNLAATLINTVTKVYNGTTASINLTNANYDLPSGAVDGDVVTFTGTLPSTGTYASKNVGTGISITSSPISVSNIHAVSSTGKPVYGYGPSSLTATGNIGIITQKALTSITGIAALSRDYNQLTGATLDLTVAPTFGGLVGSDNLTITSATGTFSDKNSANGKTVTVTNIVLGGTDAGNYSLPGSVTTTASIYKLNITAVTGITAQDKVYDGNTSATLNSGSAGFTGLLSGDTLEVGSATGAFVDKNAGTAKTVNITGLTLTGLDAINYNLTTTTATTAANITKKLLTSITGITALNKTYDGGTSATLNTGSAAFGGRIGSDVLTISSATGNFVNKDVGTGKTVNVTGIVLGGTDAGNYDLPGSVTATANILRALLSVTANNQTLSYSGVGYAGGNGIAFSGFVGGESVTDLAGSLTYGGSSQGAINGGTYAITPSGYTSGNYTISYVSGVLTITGGPVVAPAVDPHEFLPKSLAVPVYPVSGLTVQLPLSVGGLNYVPASEAGVPLAATAAAAPTANGEAGEPVVGKATDRIDKGASRAIQGPTDVLVINGGVNLGIKPVSAE